MSNGNSTNVITVILRDTFPKKKTGGGGGGGGGGLVLEKHA